MTEYRMGKRQPVTDKPLVRKKASSPVYLLAKLHTADDTKARRVLVEEVCPHHYAFGKTLTPWRPWLTYAENMGVEE
jgi:hypothetical protein